MGPADFNILLLEAEPDIARFAELSLRARGFTNITLQSRVCEARNAWNASPGKFQLLLTDLFLADGSAEDFVKEVNSAEPGVAVIVMSGNFEEDAMHALPLTNANSTRFLAKPFTVVKLIDAIQRAYSRLN
jgi:DNA-binding NtrC family response regulator